MNSTMTDLIQFWNQGSYSQMLILCDDHTREHCYPILAKVLDKAQISNKVLVIPHGEENKNLESAMQIWSECLELKADRNSLLLNLGGGMICDLGAFAASLYKRGIDFIHLPTSLLAMVDAAIGGKNGVDLHHIKNLIGSFRPAQAVFLYLPFLKSLPDTEFISGMAEVHKHALISDQWLWQEHKHLEPQTIDGELVLNAASIKYKIVERDPYEKAERKLLNFGHSIGHGMESFFLSEKNPISHGFAVAAGMICESYISFKRSMINEKEFLDIVESLDAIYPKLELKETSHTKIIEFIKNDKKNREGKFLFVLLQNIGKAKFDQEIKEEEIKDALNYYSNEF